MKKKRWYAAVVGLVMTVAVLMGVIAIAAEYGTQDDPLVSLSYINSVFAPELQKKIDAEVARQISAYSGGVDSKIESYTTALKREIAEFVSENAGFAAENGTLDAISAAVAAKVSGAGADSSSFTLVKLAAGQTMVCSVGTEVLLRIGNASCVSSGTPGLIDTTDAVNLPNGGALSKNHLYLCTVEGRGVYAPSGATLLVRGVYTVK